MDDPFGTGQRYEPHEIIDMMYDLTDYSQYSRPFDEFDIITGDVNNDTVLDSSIYNMVSPEGLRGVLFEGAGE